MSGIVVKNVTNQINERGHVLAGHAAPCHKCGTPTDLNLLDMKDDGTGNWEIAECEACYGPGWKPAFTTNENESVF